VFRRLMGVTPHEYRARCLRAGAATAAGGSDAGA